MFNNKGEEYDMTNASSSKEERIYTSKVEFAYRHLHIF